MREIRPELLDELLSGYEKPSDLLGADGIFRALRKRRLERAECRVIRTPRLRER